MDRDKFLKEVAHAIPDHYTIAFHGRDQLHIRRADKSLITFVGVNFHSPIKLADILATISKENK